MARLQVEEEQQKTPTLRDGRTPSVRGLESASSTEESSGSREEKLIVKKELLMKKQQLLNRQKELQRERITTEEVASQKKTTFTQEEMEKNSILRQPGIQRAEERVLERGSLGTLEGNLAQLIKGGGSGRIDAAVKPFEYLESLVSTPLLAAQRGDYNKMPEEFIQAVKGTRVGEWGDIFVGTGMPEPTANALGLVTDMTIGGAIFAKAVGGVISGVKRVSDLKALGAVDDLVAGAKRASEASRKLTNQFWQGIDDIKVHGRLTPEGIRGSFHTIIEKLPTKVKRIINEDLMEQIGKTYDKIETLGEVRIVKQIIGGIKSGAFSKGASGLSQSRMAKKISKAYGYVASYIDDTLKSSGRAKDARKLIKVNDAAESVINASKRVTNSVVSRSGERMVGKGVEKVTKLSGASFREDARLIAKQSRKANHAIKKGTKTLKRIAARESAWGITKSVAKTLLFAGIAGSVGAKMARKTIEGLGVGGSTSNVGGGN